ncbi:extracellular solute-binding protein [Paenarthrobacter sp. Z7-10]|uniref:ABC transporter substrate-binding protein n=1 Tax=Paenarthrobacter sp. Z7-10 TaxID=2787635 RepID=UPI0022A9B43C|nr:extracellular solute-binding protein [Paenarthrobacter sp. Z7-10]MCZ2404365.1 extracellular solute-binding protein [Paenarthrobacter sp. Z7-10]
MSAKAARTALLSVLSVAALALSGCATGQANHQTTSSSFDSSAQLKGKLTVMGFGTGDEVATTRFDNAKAALSGVQVNLLKGSLDIQQFLSSVASGQSPDIIYGDRGQIDSFAARGAVIPLDDCISGEKIDTSSFRKTALDQVSLNGHVYGIPEFNQVEITMANPVLLKQAGLDMADIDGSSWDKITAASQSLSKTKDGKLAVIGYDSKLPDFFPLWVKANGGSLISDDGKKATLDSPEVVQALTFAAAIYQKQGGFGAVKAFRDSADFFGKGNQFASNTLGAMAMEQWYVNILNDVSPKADVDFTTFKDRQGAPLSFSSGSAWAIPKGSPNPGAACRFAKSMTSTDSWMKAAAARVQAREKDGKPFTGLFTGNQMADQKIKDQFVKADPATNWGRAIEASYTANESSFAYPANPAGAEFKTAWQDAVNHVINGQDQPASALAKAQQVAQKALDAGWAQLNGAG